MLKQLTTLPLPRHQLFYFHYGQRAKRSGAEAYRDKMRSLAVELEQRQTFYHRNETSFEGVE